MDEKSVSATGSPDVAKLASEIAQRIPPDLIASSGRPVELQFTAPNADGLRVILRAQDRQITITLLTPSNAAAASLQPNVPALSSALETAGFRVDQISVVPPTKQSRPHLIRRKEKRQ